MPVELRKRKAPAAPPAPAPIKKKAATAKGRKPAAKAKEDAKKPDPKAEKPSKDEEATDSAPEAPEEQETVKDTKKDAKDEAKDEEKKPAAAGKIAVGDVIDLEGFGGEIQTNDGEKTTLKKLVDDSKSGVVLFTYPKASTPGCKSFPSTTSLPFAYGVYIPSAASHIALPARLSASFATLYKILDAIALADWSILRHHPSVPLPRFL